MGGVRGHSAAIPPAAGRNGGEALTALVCPDCAGTLVVRREGAELSFRCRIGHVYAVPELLEAKEEVLERRLWSVVAALEELAAALRDLGLHAERAERAERDAAAVRRVIEDNDPVTLGCAPSDPHPDPDPGRGVAP